MAEKLRDDKLHVWFDEWEIQPGEMIGQRIEKGLEASRVLVLCMSRHYFSSKWSTFESGTFRFRDPTNKERRFIPLRLDESEVPDALRQFAYVDWVLQRDGAYGKLLESIRPPPPSRSPLRRVFLSSRPSNSSSLLATRPESEASP